uniref:Uncharacterized protein n=1 Tax=Solanum tuberosum TaxID=4113 RepID=M1DJK6_SOLTU
MAHLNGPRQGPRPTFMDRECAPRAVVLPVVLEAVAPLLCTSQYLAKARTRSLPRSVVLTTVRGDGLGHDLTLWRQGLQALVPSDVHEPHSPSSTAPWPVVVPVVPWAVATLTTPNSLKTKGAPRPPSRAVKLTITHGPSREG